MKACRRWPRPGSPAKVQTAQQEESAWQNRCSLTTRRGKPWLAGVSKLARAVRSTLGPRGRNAVLDKGWGSPKVTKDGVTVAENVELDDPYENLGAQLVKEAASKTNDVAGDGTTTATVLAEAIFKEGLKMIAAGADPMALSRGIAKATEAVIEAIKKLATPINEKNKKEIMQVATIAGNNDPSSAASGRRVSQSRQRRRHHGRGGPAVRNHGRSGRGHAIRPRLSLAALRHQSGRADGRAGKLPAS